MEKDGPEGEVDMGFVGDFFGSLPEGFVANALALTSPKDVCRLSLVSSGFRSASEWDAVWERFLPPDYKKILAETEDGGRTLRFDSKKELYLRLCDRPVIIDGGKKSFSLDKWSGKKCYMLAARDLSITCGDTPLDWRWISVPESRFAEVAEFISVCWLEVHGTISTSILSTDTRYVAYLVYTLKSKASRYDYQPAEVSIRISGVESQTEMVFLHPEAWLRQSHQHAIQAGSRMEIVFVNHLRRLIRNHSAAAAPLNGPKQRQDGWLEIKLGEFLNDERHGEVEMSMTEEKGGHWKSGLFIQGIEIRPEEEWFPSFKGSRLGQSLDR